jgi:hypothetical protein
MALIPAADLAAMREVMGESLSTPCLIQRQGIPTIHPSGRPTVELADPIPTVCTISDNSSESESVEGGKLVARADVTILLPVSTAIKPQDRITVGTTTYEVLTPDTGRSRALCVEVAARRVQG